MDKKLFSVYDAAGEQFAPIAVFETEGLAIRSLQELFLKEDTLVSMHPADFKLYFLGYYNTRTGEIQALDKPQFVISADSIRQQMLLEKERAANTHLQDAE